MDTLTLEQATGCTSGQGILRFLTCGSVDDGKSTLIGRLLFDTGEVLDDQLEALESDNRRFGTVKGALDFALLVDGLRAEREQGITIDVAYRYFSTPRRKFMVVDAPGHEQYTRNMATGASACDLAVMLVDARKGLLTQTRRHAHIVHLLGIRHVVLAVNKMDLVSYSIDKFSAVATEFEQFARALGLERVACIPVVASSGGNIVHRCQPMAWYSGETLLEHLERAEVANGESDKPFRMPVQLVSRPTSESRGFAGTLATGRCARAIPSSCCRPEQPPGWQGSSRATGTSTKRLPVTRLRSCSRTRWKLDAAAWSHRRSILPNWRTRSPRT